LTESQPGERKSLITQFSNFKFFAQGGLCKSLDTCFSTRMMEGENPARQYALLDLDCSSVDLTGIQFMTCDYIKGIERHYMPKENFLYLRKSERMIEKITLPTHIHLLDHIIIPIHIRKSHWFPAHIRNRSISLLDSSQIYSAAAYPHQRMLIWNSSGWYGQHTPRW